jgi:hypothetical protein
MWFPLGLFFLGTGDAKSCGMISLIVGIVTVMGGFYQAAMPPGNLWDGAILITFGLFYCLVAHALIWGVENMKSVGNTSLMVAIICAIYCIANLNGYPQGLAKVAATPYLAFMFATFVILTVAVWANCYGKISGKVVGGMLILFTFTGLIMPAFSLFLLGKFPF